MDAFYKLRVAWCRGACALLKVQHPAAPSSMRPFWLAWSFIFISCYFPCAGDWCKESKESAGGAGGEGGCAQTE
eukprot:scaffold121851_cov14-Tisochrysis_lutea.AAC.1